MIYDLVIKDADGKVKEVFTSKELHARHWNRFHDYNEMMGLVSEVIDSEEERRKMEKFLEDDVY